MGTCWVLWSYVISFKIGLGLSFSPDGQRIVSGGDKTVKIWDASESTE